MANQENTDFETRSLYPILFGKDDTAKKWHHNIKYLIIGLLFGIVFVKSGVVSWFRIQEMFRLQSFHMYWHYWQRHFSGDHFCLAYQEVKYQNH